MPSVYFPYINIALDLFALVVVAIIFFSCFKEIQCSVSARLAGVPIERLPCPSSKCLKLHLLSRPSTVVAGRPLN